MNSPTPTPSRGPSSGSNSSGGPPTGDNQMSNLYLYTFLATLLLLLAISVLIVGRSIFIRRRARQMMEEAIRNGTLPPQTGRPPVKFGAKPKLFDVYTTRNGIPGKRPLDDNLLSWENLKPLSATLRRPVSPSPRTPAPQPSPPGETTPPLLLRLAPQLRPTPRAVITDTTSHPLETHRPTPNPVLTVSVIIAMPTPLAISSLNSSEDSFPPVHVGITHLQIPRGWPTDAKP